MKTHIQKWGNSLALRIPKSSLVMPGYKKIHPLNYRWQKGAYYYSAKKSELKLEQLWQW
jgi:hypothetical protein